jgi:enoyl-CoA hydratase
MSVIYEERDAIAFVRLNRPAERNAVTSETLAQLGEIFAGLERGCDARGVVLSGAGDDFCAGMDSAEFASLDAQDARTRWAAQARAVCDAIEACGAPVIGAVWGLAAGVGCELALACHLRVSTSDAVFRLSELDAVNFSLDGTAQQRLARAIGPAHATIPDQQDLTGETLLQHFVTRIVPRAEALSSAEELARQIADNAAPLAVRACLAAVTRGARLPLADGLKLEAELFAGLFATEDAREGFGAFLEKRAPVFKGR